jgi:hypothetical protein
LDNRELTDGNDQQSRSCVLFEYGQSHCLGVLQKVAVPLK